MRFQNVSGLFKTLRGLFKALRGVFKALRGGLKPKFRSFLFQIETKQRVSSRGARWKSPEAEWRSPETKWRRLEIECRRSEMKWRRLEAEWRWSDARCSLNWIPVSTGMTGALLPVSRTPEPLNREPLKLSANARPVFAKACPFI
jgi:hypothetical protein